MSRNILFSLVVLINALAFATVLSSCKQERRAQKMPESVNAYVYAYTSGIISRGAPIRVRFASMVASENELGQEADSRILSFSPAINGTAKWEDGQTLRFDAASPLPSSTTFVATVQLKKIFPDVPEDATSFEFDFRTRDQYLELKVEGLSPPNPRDLSKQELQGSLLTADLAEAAAAEQTLLARQGKRELSIDWSHSSDGTAHYFSVQDIARGEKASKVELQWNGNSIGVDTRDSREVEVPAIDDFKVTDGTVVQGQDQYIQLYFSDPLLESQNLEGLVSIAGYGSNFRYIIEGNKLRLYPTSRLVGEHTVQVNTGIRNINNKRMSTPSEWAIRISDAMPQVRLVGRGVIMPNSEGLVFPFEAISLTAVEVEVFKIYHNNILQFLQSNELDGSYDLYRVGRIIMQKKVPLLSLNPNASSSEWTRYALDLSQLIEEDAEAIYQVRIGFRPEYSTYFCNQPSDDEPAENMATTPQNEGEEITESIMESWYGIGGYYQGYSWNQREDPCYPAYYNSDRFIQRNVIASNLGLIAKGGSGNSFFVAVTDLRTTAPVGGAALEFYDFQQQLLAKAATDGQGMASVELSRKPFVVIARQGNEKGYLRLEDGNALSLSRFDVSGAIAQKGLKGFLYGERGVWRPGDSVYLDFILEDREGKLPPNYPVTFELRDPRGQVQEKRSVAQQVNNIYPLHFATHMDDPTGSWMATARAGGATFEKTIRIETVKPNRIKIGLNFGSKSLSIADEPIRAKLNAEWLHGAPARGLRAKVEVQAQAANTVFKGFDNYEFDDPARSFEAEARTVFEGQLDESGQASLQFRLANRQLLPGKLTANFKSRVFEKGGDFSSDSYSIPYDPFEAYAGILLPENKYGEKRIDLNKQGRLSFASVSKDGKPLANRQLSVGVYRVEWRWWWDQGYDNISRYNTSTHYDARISQEVTTNGKGLAEWSFTPDEWGRYLVRVCDTQTGHCSGEFLYAGYPWYGDEADDSFREAAAMLSLSSDKDKYLVGETVQLKLPEGESGRVLITIENGTKVLQSFWADARKGENTFTFQASPEMAPNVYAHVSLVQPHAQVKNDLPIRLYGVIPIYIEDPKTRLAPQASLPEELKPGQEFTVAVSENNGQPMAYTLAVVDEGLLGLTRFETPDPWQAFYAREALGVRTWDVYDHVLGAYGAELERLLSIGGDGELRRGAQEDRANRFKPVAIHLGPFELKKGKTAKHKIRMPNYVGAVRVMVVAADQGAYGKAEKTVPVRQPLMVLATLPRVLSPGEKLMLPVNVFAMDNKVKAASVSLQEKSGLVRISGPSTQNVQFSGPGDRLANFEIEVKEAVGVARFVVNATGGGEKSSQEIEIQVRNPNPYVTDVDDKVLDAGQSTTFTFTPPGIPGTNSAILEVSSIPPINLGKRLEYLLRYPYGCLEQTLSGGFPQLYVRQLMELDEKQEEKIPRNINATISRLRQFQTSNGGFAYWPGGHTPDHWATSYAGHFLLEAQALGYSISPAMLDQWLQFQKKVARMWDPRQEEYGFYGRSSYELMQAYRLYTLALAKAPDLAAMNRLREYDGLSVAAKWRLAAAYALAGKPEVAQQITRKLETAVSDYQEMSYTYGSEMRDRAMILEALLLIDEREKAAAAVKYLSDELSGKGWCSTQEISFALLAIGKFVGESGLNQKLAFSYEIQGGKRVNAGSGRPLMQIAVPLDGTGSRSVSVSNTSEGTLFTRLIRSGQPASGAETASAEGLRLELAFKDTDGQPIQPGAIAQGTDFIAEVRVTHSGSRPFRYEELALRQIFPSGWEIINTRMDKLEAFTGGSQPEYQDIRDDRVNTFFDLPERKSEVYRVQLNAAYQGRFYLPAVLCEAMYDQSINARVPGRWVEVTAPREI